MGRCGAGSRTGLTRSKSGADLAEDGLFPVCLFSLLRIRCTVLVLLTLGAELAFGIGAAQASLTGWGEQELVWAVLKGVHCSWQIFWEAPAEKKAECIQKGKSNQVSPAARVTANSLPPSGSLPSCPGQSLSVGAKAHSRADQETGPRTGLCRSHHGANRARFSPDWVTGARSGHRGSSQSPAAPLLREHALATRLSGELQSAGARGCSCSKSQSGLPASWLCPGWRTGLGVQSYSRLPGSKPH